MTGADLRHGAGPAGRTRPAGGGGRTGPAHGGAADLAGDQDVLRQIIREVLAEVLPGLRRRPASAGPAGSATAGQRTTATAGQRTTATAGQRTTATAGQGPAATADRGTVATGCQGGQWTVRLSTDDDLRGFVLRVLRMADNPKLRRDLISGRARFRLAGSPADGTPPAEPPPAEPPATAVPATAAPAAEHRVDKGAVTERIVTAAAAAGARLVLGPRAVLTPLARDRARALGVPIEKER